MQTTEEKEHEITMPFFDYHEKHFTLSEIKKNVELLKDELCQKSKRCYTLELDLVTQMNPLMIQAVKEAKETYEKCKACMAEVNSVTENNNSEENLKEPVAQMLTTG